MAFVADDKGCRDMLGAWPRGPEGITGAMGVLYARGPVGIPPGGGSRSLRGPLGGRRLRNGFRSTCAGGAAVPANRDSPASDMSGLRSGISGRCLGDVFLSDRLGEISRLMGEERRLWVYEEPVDRERDLPRGES